MIKPEAVERMKREIEHVVNRVVIDDDLGEDEAGLQDYKIYRIPYSHLILAVHKLLVVGTKAKPPADITSTSHWLSRASRNDQERFYTRMTVDHIRAIPAHQIVAAVFFERRAVWGTSEYRSLGREERKVQLARCVSHRCHVAACLNPDHLIIETPAENDKRQKCSESRFCHSANHQASPCIMDDLLIFYLSLWLSAL